MGKSHTFVNLVLRLTDSLRKIRPVIEFIGSRTVKFNETLSFKALNDFR